MSMNRPDIIILIDLCKLFIKSVHISTSIYKRTYITRVYLVYVFNSSMSTDKFILINVKDIDIKDGEKDIVKVKDLKSSGFLQTDSKLVDKCDGYVETKSEKDYNTGEYTSSRRAERRTHGNHERHPHR